MDLKRFITNKVKTILNENSKSNVNLKIKNIILNGSDIDDFITALSLKYGNTVPLFHATSEETAKLIDVEGFKLTDGKNYTSFSNEDIIYFQIGKSDYVSSDRPVLYRVNVPLDFIATYAYADMDNVSIDDDDLVSVGVDMDTFEHASSDMRDIIMYFVWNQMTLEGMELLIADRNGDGNIFNNLKPIRLS